MYSTYAGSLKSVPTVLAWMALGTSLAGAVFPMSSLASPTRCARKQSDVVLQISTPLMEFRSAGDKMRETTVFALDRTGVPVVVMLWKSDPLLLPWRDINMDIKLEALICSLKCTVRLPLFMSSVKATTCGPAVSWITPAAGNRSEVGMASMAFPDVSLAVRLVMLM